MEITEVTRYLATDGSQFSTRRAADKYLAQAARIEELMAPLAPRPDDFPYDGYLQQDLPALIQAWNGLLDLAKELIGPHHWFDQSRDMQADSSWAGRLIGELDHKAIWNRGWFRMQCINRENGREYNQPYYAAHLEETTDFKCLNLNVAIPAP